MDHSDVLEKQGNCAANRRLVGELETIFVVDRLAGCPSLTADEIAA
jgi:hypothetical protein